MASMRMQEQSFSTAILFLVFNRPALTARVFEIIRQVRPARLYLAADGPRPGINDDVEKCRETKKIISNVDWPCEVKTLFKEKNLGCGKAVSTAITWFFENESEGIILEDDTLPAEDFFRFCVELLEQYRNDHRVMQIGGGNFLPPTFKKSSFSYYFSNHNNIWGWATWKRAWDLYDYSMSTYHGTRSMDNIRKYFTSIHEDAYFSFVFERTARLPEITWDYQWEFVRRMNSGLTIVPNANLVMNIGFDSDATHTVNTEGRAANMAIERIVFPLNHPKAIVADHYADKSFFMHCLTNRKSRIKTVVKALLPARIRDTLLLAAVRRYTDQFERYKP